MQRCELYLLDILCWDLNTVTPLHFISQHLYQGVVFSDDKTVSGDPIDSKMLQKIRRHVDYFSVLAIKQDFMLMKQFDD